MPYVKSDGVNIYYETYGTGSPALVFLHSFTQSSYAWVYQIFDLSRDYQCVLLDNRGHGRSDKPQQGYGMAQMAKDAVAVLDELGLDKVILVGNSLGGMIGVQFCVDYPERVLGNIAVSPAIGIALFTPKEQLDTFMNNYEEGINFLLDGCLSQKSREERPEIVEMMKGTALSEESFPRYAFDAICKDPTGIFYWDIRERLQKEYKTPTLFFAGAEDHDTPLEANKALADSLPGVEFQVIQEVGHVYHLEKPLEFNAVIRKFASQVS
ncbi:MAG: alpha/beta hydrolase [Xenococcaceae cyanobacterium MO_188.B32]|nr:alpha/beta hydrolase [Xenococcaceae cyanobacterium MO_188.B32]